MITVSGVNSKKVNDPVFLSARKFMEERIKKLEASGPAKELALAKKRYEGLTAKDVIIEPPVSFDSGIVQCCFVSRKTGFFRADIEVEKVDVRLIFDEFSVNVTEYDTTDDLVAQVKSEVQGEGVVFIKATGKYGIVTVLANANPDNTMEIMGDIYWDEIRTNTLDAMDAVEKNTGTFSVTAINIDQLQGLLFIIEDLQAIA